MWFIGRIFRLFLKKCTEKTNVRDDEGRRRRKKKKTCGWGVICVDLWYFYVKIAKNFLRMTRWLIGTGSFLLCARMKTVSGGGANDFKFGIYITNSGETNVRKLFYGAVFGVFYGWGSTEIVPQTLTEAQSDRFDIREQHSPKTNQHLNFFQFKMMKSYYSTQHLSFPILRFRWK